MTHQTIEQAVVGDWEASFSKLYKTLGYKDELSFEEIPPDIQLKQFIASLLAAKDREIEEAYKKGFIDGGLQNLPDRPLNSERE